MRVRLTPSWRAASATESVAATALISVRSSPGLIRATQIEHRPPNNCGKRDAIAGLLQGRYCVCKVPFIESYFRRENGREVLVSDQ